MCNFRKLLAGVVLICITTSSLAEGDAGYYGYGKSATATEIAGWDIDIRADGQGLPPGSGSVEDGEVIYEAKCAECHGSFGEGVGQFPVLAGGTGTMNAERPLKIVGSYWAHTSTLWDYIHRAMPFMQPESLEDDEVYALVAYVLYLNDVVDDDYVMTQDNFTDIQLANREHFVPDPRPDVHNTRCMENCKNAADIKVVSIVRRPVPVAAEVAVAAEPAKPHAGEKVYNQYCVICHKAGVAGAPKKGDAKEWNTRLEAGIAVVTEHALKGYTGNSGVMPAKGGFMHLSDEEVRQAVQYLVEPNK